MTRRSSIFAVLTLLAFPAWSWAADGQPSKPAAPASDGAAQSPAAESPAPMAVRRRPDLTIPYVAPRTELEQAMAQSWSAILHIDGIGVYDNFFELGGDSLQATILLNRLQEQLGKRSPATCYSWSKASTIWPTICAITVRARFGGDMPMKRSPATASRRLPGRSTVMRPAPFPV